MSVRGFVASVIFGSWVVLLSGCAVETLDYDTALNLLRDRKSEPVTISFSALPGSGQSDPKVKVAYDQLVAGHVLSCDTTVAVGTLCQPGPAADGLTGAGSTDLSLVVGRWVPSVITKISRSARGTAAGEARLTFEPSSLYKEYQDAFEVLQSSAESHISMAEQKEGKNVKLTYIYGDDGWHLDSVE